MKHLIMGTAGHIDHGKTALVKALTGIECDTHREEKQRGITINLGFAHINLSDQESIAIIDVPGHKDFIHTMVAGASGIDFVLMVIAADSGTMPQTREHLQIMQMLEVTHGIIALTKIDTVDEETVEIAVEDIKDFTKDTFLENAPILPVSSMTGKGIPEIKKAIRSCSEKVSERSRHDLFRLFIDRIFTVSGFGTVVTGSVIEGILKPEDKVFLLPTEKKLRVRRLERHGKEVPSVVAGDRASLNLVGLSRSDYKRGMVITNKLIKSTAMIDVQLTLFPQTRRIDIWSSAIFLLGTFESQVKIHLLDRNSAQGGDTFIAQIHLPQPCIIQMGDRFIVRSTSNDLTLGGGHVIDQLPLHHRRRPQKLIDTLTTIASGSLSERIAIEIRKSKTVLTIEEVAQRLHETVTAVSESIANTLPDDIRLFTEGEKPFVITEDQLLDYERILVKSINIYHQKYPMESSGKSLKECVGIVGLSGYKEGETFIAQLLADCEKRNIFRKVDATWVCADHEVVISDEFKTQTEQVNSYFKELGLKVAPPSEITEMARRNNIDGSTLQQILRHLVQKKLFIASEGEYVHAQIVESVRMTLLKKLAETPQGLTVAEFRDLIADNRKICLRLFAIYDAEGITIRKGDRRIITEQGRQLLADQ